MKKGLLLAIGVTATMSLVAQQQQECVARKMNLTLEQTTRNDAEQSPSFYSQAHNTQRLGGSPTTQITGTHISSSWNALTLLVSQSNCLTANQALGLVMFTHRISIDWPAAGVNSGYIQQSWTTNNGGSWDSTYTDNDGVTLFRYPSGAILNTTGNTNIANANFVIAGPYTDGTAWQGYYASNGSFISGFGHTGNPVASNNTNSFPRIDMAAYANNTAWFTGGIYTDDDNGAGYSGAVINKADWDGASTVTWSSTNVTPAFHADGAGVNDCYTMTHVAFNAAGSVGYIVFFGVQAAASTPETRTFSPIVYQTTDSGATWGSVWAPFDFSTIPVISQNIFPTNSGQYVKPWFSMNNGSECLVDVNNNLHVICTIESGYSDSNDSLSYTGAPTGFTTHYIYDVYTTGMNTWDAVLVDSILCDPTTTQSPFTDGSAAYDLDARLQASISPSRDHIFYLWADTDPQLAGGENAYPDIYGVGIDWTTDMKTQKKQFTNDGEGYWHYNSNNALVSGSTYTIPTTNSIDRDGTHITLNPFDHYYINNVTFDESEFTIPIGINESIATFGTVAAYPNPANEVLNLNITLNNSEMTVITMTNMLGQVVMTENKTLAAGANTVQLNTSNLQAGVYFVNVTAAGSTATSKIVVE
jgi:hypothetical protein